MLEHVVPNGFPSFVCQLVWASGGEVEALAAFTAHQGRPMSEAVSSLATLSLLRISKMAGGLGFRQLGGSRPQRYAYNLLCVHQ